jgi:putative ABC transport system ATP-binding protein
METQLELRNVHKKYKMGDAIIHAVENVSLQINAGDFIAITGPSGSGKSTMMNLVGALDMATEGDIYLGGQNIKYLEESELAQIRGRKIGFVFQTFNLIPTQTALENVTLPMLFQGTEKNQREERAKELLEKVGLSDRMHHLPNELSGGERQRVAIARAMANNPDIILADEPTGNLDSKAGEEIVNLFKNLNSEGKTIVVVTHNEELAKKTKRIIKLKDGRIL